VSPRADIDLSFNAAGGHAMRVTGSHRPAGAARRGPPRCNTLMDSHVTIQAIGRENLKAARAHGADRAFQRHARGELNGRS
jgi:hypothetical protein